ncbi:MAG TPA: sigma-70 family RNA polymerase sigma factor [Pirellulales bacterium]|nr:sigma-70 family RNA polymerase sigma factor [Pirellulales bacterium]
MPSTDRDSRLPDESQTLFDRFRAGDERAAAAIYDRYAEKLLAFARRRLSRKVAARIDPDDVVQSAYRSFFLRAQEGEYRLGRNGDLWRLLASIALHKLLKQVRRHTAGRRAVARETACDALSLGASELACREPTPEQAASLADELAQVFSGLQAAQRTIFELRLQGYELREIAAQTGKSERTVRRCLAEIKRRLTERRTELDGSEPMRSTERRPTVRRSTAPPPGADAPLRFDDYLLQRLIGAGGMGKAYAALEKRAQRPVCVKVLHKSRLTNPRAVARFVDEARIVARLRRPNIVAVHGLGRLPDGGYFMVFDLIDGQDLMQTIRQRQLPIEEARAIALCVADAIEHAHSQGIVHCDLKPSNVLVDGDGRIAVADFGLARVTGSGNSAAEDPDYIAGTAAYMAPEQADRRFGPIDERTDVYGLGALLYALLTGRPPLAAATAAEALRQLVSPTAQPPRPSELRPETPDELNEFCLRCLSQRPALRFASVREAAEALSLRHPCRESSPLE